MRANSSDERAGHRRHRAVEGLLETETGLDADRQQVEHVGQLHLHGVLALLDASGQHGVGTDEQGEREQHEREELDEPFEIEGVPDVHHDEDHRDERHRDHADGEEAIDRVGGAVAGEDELLADVVDVADRREPSAEAGEPAEHRCNGALREGDEQFLVAHVLDFVAVELAERAAHDRLLVELREDRVHDQRDRCAEQQTAEE